MVVKEVFRKESAASKQSGKRCNICYNVDFLMQIGILGLR